MATYADCSGPRVSPNEDGATDGSCAPRWPMRAAGGL